MIIMIIMVNDKNWSLTKAKWKKNESFVRRKIIKIVEKEKEKKKGKRKTRED